MSLRQPAQTPKLSSRLAAVAEAHQQLAAEAAQTAQKATESHSDALAQLEALVSPPNGSAGA